MVRTLPACPKHQQTQLSWAALPVQVRDIVRHAASLFIEIIPEIELPGHCVSALASYPQVSCESLLFLDQGGAEVK